MWSSWAVTLKSHHKWHKVCVMAFFHFENLYRPVVPGCAGCAMAHPDFGRSLNSISSRGTDYNQLNTTGTPGFSDLPTALYYAHCTGCITPCF